MAHVDGVGEALGLHVVEGQLVADGGVGLVAELPSLRSKKKRAIVNKIGDYINTLRLP